MARLPRFGRSKASDPAEARSDAPEASDGAPAPEKKKRFAPKVSFDVLKDPSKRIRLLIWGFAGLFLFAGIMIVALGATSSYWFCANGCHKVQDDTITAYQHSVHNRVNCMACHMPVNASPVTFMLHKVEALGELYMTVTNNFDLPLNARSEVSAELPSAQCTQCHTTNRKITPTAGILIDHKKHADEGITCTTCHNRVAHVEDFQLKNKDPKSGEPNLKHADFMTMNGCFRCHSQAQDAKAPGDCAKCHSASFDLVPAFHKQPDFFPKQHGKLALEEQKAVAEATKQEEAFKASQASAGKGDNVAAAAEAPGHEELPNIKTVNTCYTCHKEKFCTDCHGGTPMPHPENFKKPAAEGKLPEHAVLGKSKPASCVKCHGAADVFCDSCHHGTQLGWEYDKTMAWKKQHPIAVAKTGANACFACHKPTFCAECHVRGGNLPPITK